MGKTFKDSPQFKATVRQENFASQLVLMPRKGVTKSERHRVHAERADGTPLCGGGHQAKRSPAWQADIGLVNCEACLGIMDRRSK
jgi:hypothetical protein